MGECSAYSSLQADPKVKFAAWPTSWRPPGADRLSLRGPKVNFRTWLCTVDDSAINDVVYFFADYNTKPQALNIVLSKVSLQRRLLLGHRQQLMECLSLRRLLSYLPASIKLYTAVLHTALLIWTESNTVSIHVLLTFPLFHWRKFFCLHIW